MLSAVRQAVLAALGSIEAWIVDVPGYSRKGKHSVAIARQYREQLGKQHNCRVAVSLSVANEQASLPVDYRAYLPRECAEDPERLRKAEVPAEVVFATKPQLALA